MSQMAKVVAATLSAGKPAAVRIDSLDELIDAPWTGQDPRSLQAPHNPRTTGIAWQRLSRLGRIHFRRPETGWGEAQTACPWHAHQQPLVGEERPICRRSEG